MSAAYTFVRSTSPSGTIRAIAPSRTSTVTLSKLPLRTACRSTASPATVVERNGLWILF